MTVGRPKKLTSPEKLIETYEEYLKSCFNHVEEVASAGKVVEIKKPRIPVLWHFLSSCLQMTRETWNQYRKDPIFSDAIMRIDEDIISRKYSAMVNGEGNVSGLMFDFRVNHNWRDKQEIDMRVNEYKITLDLGNEDKTIK